EVQSLRAQLVVIAEQLKGSMRNAADAEQRAQTAQSRERETRARLLQVEHAKHQADLEVTRQTEEMKRYRLQIDTLERQKMQMEVDMRAVEKERDEAVDSATDAKDALRQYKQFIRDAQARDEGLETGRRLGLRRGYNTGRVNGFEDGLQEGFDEGYELGRQEGFLAAKNEVRRVERARTRDNLDSYIEIDRPKLKRTRTWAESLSRHEDDLVAVEPSSLHSSSTVGVGSRRKGPKSHPKLPLSVFTPPTSGASDRFPLPPSPSAVHPTTVTDSHVIDINTWKSESEGVFSSKADGIVVPTNNIEAINGYTLLERFSDTSSILAASIPLPAETGTIESVPTSAAASSVRIHFSATLDKSSPALIETIAHALKQGRIVDLHCDLGQTGSGWEVLENLIEKTMEAQEARKGKLVLSNILPPPHSLELPIVKLLTHQTYIAYQSYIASISLNSNIFLKFLPPAWGEPTPQASLNDLSKEAKEWKRRVKMFLGPAVEAFGFQRILFGSSPSPAAANSTSNNVAYWYEIARESFAELGVEQEDIDAVFSGNAKAVYGS
ncbi:uncharacterized protein FOMMEDRAFT_84801, partial [Fomitiporia mediterranea MF3/22]|uniref:uncharacterized protein n=1 Tax=Fomitiporia mediterranea (strain MF3/22) TaxID=694068 RepID=UPI000440750A